MTASSCASKYVGMCIVLFERPNKDGQICKGCVTCKKEEAPNQFQWFNLDVVESNHCIVCPLVLLLHFFGLSCSISETKLVHVQRITDRAVGNEGEEEEAKRK